MKYLLIVLLVAGVGCGNNGVGIAIDKKDTIKKYYVLNGNDTLWFKGDSVFVIDSIDVESINAWMRGEDSIVAIDTILICDTIPIYQPKKQQP